MIKVKVNNEYKDIVKIFCGGILQKEIIKVWSREAQDYVYESSVEYTGTLPITIAANGDALLDYRIYGASMGMGVATENLFDKKAKDTANGYEDKKVLQPNGTSPKVTGDEYYFITEYIEIPNNVTNLTIVRNSSSSISGICFYDANKEYISGSGNMSYNSPVIISCPTGAVFFRTSILRSYIDNAMVVEGSTAPTSYVPYGYKLPMVTMSENLFDAQGKDNYGYYNNFSGEYINDRNYKYWRFHVKEGDVIRWTKPGAGYGCCFLNGVRKLRIYDTDTPYTIPRDVDEITNNFASNVWESAMVTKNQPLPDQYVPYSRTDTPVYIGENKLESVEGVADYVDKSSGKIVRHIKEYTFTGEEDWYAHGVGFYGKRFLDAITSDTLITIRFSHFTARSNTPLGSMYYSRFGNDCGCFRASESNVMVRSTANFTTAEECKAYFKAQYDNGTPVKMWYILATPAEEDPPVSFPDIPTIEGETIIDYDGEPKPSQMYVKYRR